MRYLDGSPDLAARAGARAGQFPCPECLVVFTSTRALATHLEEEHD